MKSKKKTIKREKKIFGVRVSDEDHHYLKSIDAAKFIHEAIAERKEIEKASGSVKPLAQDIITDLARAYVQDFEESSPNMEESEEKWWSQNIGGCLFDISKLTLKALRRDPETGEERTIPPARLEDVIELTKEKESREFLMHIKEKCGEIVIGQDWHPQPVTEEEMETIRQIYAEAKILLERRYRKVFGTPPGDWDRRYASFSPRSVDHVQFVYFDHP